MKENKKPVIRFINSRYQDLFHIPDGGTIRVVFPDRIFVQKCQYIDDYHTKIGSTIYHICEYAEMLERGGGRCEPEGETYLTRAAWEIDGRGYLLIEKQGDRYSYEVVRKDYSSRTHGSIDQSSKTMIEAREHVLESLALDQKSRYPVSFEQIREKMQSMLKASEITQIVWLDSKYYPHVRTAEHALTCMARGEMLHLTYEVSGHDDGKGFTIHSDGEDIWDRMSESELRIFEEILDNAVEFGHWKRDIDQADTLSAVRDVRFSLHEVENLNLSREQIGQLDKMIIRKEKSLVRQQRPAGSNRARETQSANTAKGAENNALKMEAKPVRRKSR